MTLRNLYDTVKHSATGGVKSVRYKATRAKRNAVIYADERGGTEPMRTRTVDVRGTNWHRIFPSKFLMRYMSRRIGDSWSAVFSDLCHQFPKAFRREIDFYRFMTNHVISLTDVDPDNNRDRYSFFVDDNGLVREVPEPTAKTLRYNYNWYRNFRWGIHSHDVTKAPPILFGDKYHETIALEIGYRYLVKVDGIWYSYTRTNNTKSPIDDRWNTYSIAKEHASLWERRTLSKKELKKMGLSNG